MKIILDKRQFILPAILFPFLLFGFTNCMGFQSAVDSSISASSSSTPSLTLDPSLASQNNVMSITVGCGYVNEPCVSVTICEPGTSTCQTIDNVLVDTGSYGLRLFSSAVTLSLTTSTNASGNEYAECVTYADTSSDWGSVATADVMMGHEKASNTPIQIIDSTFATAPASCTNLDTSPAKTGFNGILGVGLFANDCGTGCATTANNGRYYTCVGTNCTSNTIPVANQVTNPVSLLALDNNGVVMQLASIPDAGAVSSSGYLIMGINTRPDNQLTSPTFLQANAYGEFTTVFNSQIYSASFIDSGSNGLFFPSSSQTTACKGNLSSFFCDVPESNLMATQGSVSGGPNKAVSFVIGNASDQLATSNPNYAFSNLGGSFDGAFDWGLPFFFGRSVAVGMDGATSSLGTGPYWAY